MARRDRIVRGLLRRKFLVTTKTDQTWEGVLVEADDLTLLLSNAAVVNPDATRTPADGQVLIPRADVAYMQQA